MRRLSALVICVFLIGAFGARAVLADTVSYGGSLTAARRGYAMSSLNDGRALLSGGIVYHVGYVASTDLYTPATHAVSAGPSMNVRRYEHTSTTLADGRVLVAGGFGGSSPNTGDVLASAEIYNPATNTFTLTGSLNIARYAASATLLNDGRVLIVGGVTFSGTFLKSAEVFDPVAGTFTLLSSQISSVAGTPTVTNLNGGTVLVAGGASPFVAPNDVPTADTFDPVTNTFTPTGNMPFGRSYHTATKLNDGRVAIVGGFGPESPDPAAQHGVFLYDPATRSFSIAGLTLFTRNRHNAVNLGDDRILIIGGDWNTGVVETEIFDVHSGASAVGPSLPESHVDAQAVLYGPTVSILGGYWHTTSDLAETSVIETYTACGSGVTAPVIDVPAAVCATAPTTASTTAAGSYRWDVLGGTINGSSSQSSVTFTPGYFATAATLFLTVTDANGCISGAEQTVSVYPGTYLSINSDFVPTCPGGTARASLQGGPDVTNILWTITNGTIVGPANGRSVEFVRTGPNVELHVTSTDTNGCAVSTGGSVQASTSPMPAINFMLQTICPGISTSATADVPWGSYAYSSYAWTISGGAIESGANARTVYFHADGSGPVTLTCTTFDSTYGCPATATGTLPLTVLSPSIDVLPNACTNDGAASVHNSWVYGNFSWSITNGTITGPSNRDSVSYSATSSPAHLSVVVTDSNGCTGTQSVDIPVHLVSAPVITAPATICPNGSGTASVAPPAEGGEWSYVSWQITHGTFDGPQPYFANGTTVTFHSDGSGQGISLTVTAVDAQSCQEMSKSSVVVASPDGTITASGPTTFCVGGSVTLTAPAGLSYLWSNGATTQAITVSGSGNYSVTVTDANGCSAMSSPAVVTVNANPTATITAGGPTTFCAGGSVTLTASSGSSYLWSNGATTQSIAASASGNYSVTVTNASGCSATSTPAAVNALAVPQKPVLSVNGTFHYASLPGTVETLSAPRRTVSDDAPSSYGFCTGMYVTISPNVTAAQYLWSTGATSPTITTTAAGTFTLTVTDANGCATTSDPVTISFSNPPAPTVTPSAAILCSSGGGVMLVASAADSYLWSTGETTQSITVTQPGDYHVSATVNGCAKNSAPVHVATAAITSNARVCNNGPIVLSATQAPGASYLWSTGETTPSISALQSGTYSVTITTAAGCSDTATTTVNPPSVTLSAPANFCDGASGVTLQATASGGDTSFFPYSYTWLRNGSPVGFGASAAFTDHPPSYGTYTYSVQAFDGNQCAATSNSVSVSYEPSPTINLSANAQALCPGGLSGASAWYIPSGWTAMWSISGGTITNSGISYGVIANVSFTAGSGSSVVLTATFTHGSCSSSASVTIPVNGAPTPVITAGGATTFCQGSSVTLTAPAGYSGYAWSTGETSQSITVASGGSYNVTVTNATGCSATSAPVTVTVNSLPAATITAGGPTTFCAGGSVTLTASSASSYLWSNGATTQAITVNAGGNYSVAVTNANGCSATSAPTAVTVNANPAATITAGGPTTFCAGGSVSLTASAGSSYLWSNGATTQAITVNTGGNYSVTVTNAPGCSATSAATAVTVNANPTATITAGGPTTFCAGGSVTLTASVGSSYLWSNGATTQAITVNTAGNYSVTVTDANGCSGTSSPMAITVNANPMVTITAGGPTTFCTGGSVTLTASSASSYLWSNGATTQAITVNAGGNYSVTVTNANGCSATSAPTVVTVNANPTATITAGGPTTFCAGGSVTLTASVGSSYLWSNGATTQAITVNTAGNYSVTVTDANGCSGTSSPMAITVNANPMATITAGGPTTFCTGGSVTLTASSASSYLWSNGATTQAITVNASGNYSVTVTDANGCSATSAPTVVTVNANPTATITAGGPTTFCAGSSVTLTASAGSSYLWSNGATTQAITVNTAGNYSVTVTNAPGCSATSAATAVAVNANPTATITAGGPTTFCTGGSVTLTASAGSSYLWSNGATTSAITVNASGNNSVTVTNANGCSATSAPTAVTVNANPTATVTAGGPTTFCAGGSVTLTASAGSSYLWSNGATTQATTVNAGGNYSVTVTNASGCSATSAATTVTVNPNPPTPAITAGGPTTFCAGGSVTLTAPAGYTYLWSTGATTQAIAVTTSGSYSVTVGNANSCSATSAATNVTVNPAPSITAFGPTSQTVRHGTAATPLTVTASGTGTKTYQWYKGSSGTTTNPISGATGTSYSPPTTTKATYTYWVRVTIGSCTADSPTATVIVN